MGRIMGHKKNQHFHFRLCFPFLPVTFSIMDFIQKLEYKIDTSNYSLALMKPIFHLITIKHLAR